MKTEQQLLYALRRRERGAGRQLYTLYSGRLMAVALRYMGNSNDAADVLQDAMVRVLTSIDRFEYRGEGSLSAWMTRITVNTALNQLKHRQPIPIDELPPNVGEEDGDTDDPAVDIPPGVLMKMIASLPDGYRTVLNLYVFEGMPHREIALQLGIRESSSASQYFRAKRMLQQKIKEYINPTNRHREEKI